jgi:hypothetical protein
VASGLELARNRLQGIYETGSRLDVSDSSTHDNAQNGVLLENALIDMLRCTASTNGVYGIFADKNSSATVTDSTISGHPNHGVRLSTSSGDFLRSTVSDNAVHGISAEVSAVVMVDSHEASTS